MNILQKMFKKLFGIRYVAVIAALMTINCYSEVHSFTLSETETLRNTHNISNLPPIFERVPSSPLVINLEERGRQSGIHGGELQTLIGRSKDVRLINVWGYARLMGFNEDFELVPDILEKIEIEDDRIFTLHLRKGHINGQMVLRLLQKHLDTIGKILPPTSNYPQVARLTF